VSDIEKLDTACIESQTRTVDWREEGWSGYDDAGRWEIVYPEREECGYAYDESLHGEATDEGDACTSCDGSGWMSADQAQESDPDWRAPMMNYAYPLDPNRAYDADDAEAVSGCLTIVRDVVEDRCYLALTGGGMDLSWEIARAHMDLGHLPPAWIRLPDMAGRGESDRDKELARAVVMSCETVADWAKGRADRARRVAGLGLSDER